VILLIDGCILTFIIIFSIYKGFSNFFFKQFLKCLCIIGSILIINTFSLVGLLTSIFISALSYMFDVSSIHFSHNVFYSASFLFIFMILYYVLLTMLKFLLKSVNLEEFKNRFFFDNILSVFFSMIQSFLIVITTIHIIDFTFSEIGRFKKLDASSSYRAFVSVSNYFFKF
tara:strand:- start:9291 stop:9803 length:513 start_codon:yes stop_codon:yes gene_type:complete